MMKKTLAIMAALCMIVAMTACGSSKPAEAPAAATTEAAQETSEAAEPAAAITTVNAGKLTMSTNAAFPPYEMTTDTGEFEGIDIELASAIAEMLGLELVVDDMDFDAALLAVQQGKSDIVMAGVSVTDERKQVMDFSDPYSNGVQVVIVVSDSDIETIDDLAGKMIGTQRGTTGNLYCTDDYGEDHVTTYDNGLTAVQALLNGQVDCVVIDQEPARSFVKANPGLKILDSKYVTEQYAIGIAKGNTALVDAVNKCLAELKDGGTLDSVISKYISAD